MRTYLDCFPCFLSQALRAARMATDDTEQIKSVLDDVGRMLSTIPLSSSPPESGRRVYQKVSEITGNPDPYQALKQKSTREALAMYPVLKRRVEAADDRLMTAVRMAIAGNVIDFGPGKAFDLNTVVEETLRRDFAICDIRAFRDALNQAESVLFIGDNAGESVFDRLLIEELNQPVHYAVRGKPIINDVTWDHAVAAGIDQVADIISSGSDAPGVILERCSPEFRAVYERSPLIISKGQGNYEALSGRGGPVFFLLKTKCRVIADHAGVAEGDIILKKARGAEAKKGGP